MLLSSYIAELYVNDVFFGMEHYENGFDTVMLGLGPSARRTHVDTTRYGRGKTDSAKNPRFAKQFAIAVEILQDSKQDIRAFFHLVKVTLMVRFSGTSSPPATFSGDGVGWLGLPSIAFRVSFSLFLLSFWVIWRQLYFLFS